MIVQIAATYGSGKSTAVRTLFSTLPGEQRRLPRSDSSKMAVGHLIADERVFLLGEYFDGSDARTWTGADTIKDLDLVFETVLAQHRFGRHVVMEGIYLMSMKRVPHLARMVPLTILHLTTSVADSLAGIAARRAAQGDARVVKDANVTGHYKTAQTFCAKMRFLGTCRVETVTRETVAPRLLELVSEEWKDK